MEKKKEGKGNLVTIISLALAAILVLFFPKIYAYIEKFGLPKVEDVKKTEVEEKKEIDQDLLDSLHYPVMRTNMYDKNTYYSLDKFTISDMSNDDILINAFLDIFEGNIVSYNGKVECTNKPMQFNVDYIELRIKNILSKNVKYTLTDFNVPEGLNTKYTGSWVYNRANKKYIYNGSCKKNTSSVRYYDLEQFVKAEYDKDDVIAYYYVGFAKVEKDNYTIYSDSKMTNQISSGKFESVQNLKEIYNNIDKSKKKAYKYTFKDTLCSYDEYCVYRGEWINGI